MAIVGAVVLLAVAQLAGATLTPQYYSPQSSPPPPPQYQPSTPSSPSHSSPPPPSWSSLSPPRSSLPPPYKSSGPSRPRSRRPPPYKSSPSQRPRSKRPPPYKSSPLQRPRSSPPSSRSSPLPPPYKSSPVPWPRSSPPPPYKSSPVPRPRSRRPPPYKSSPSQQTRSSPPPPRPSPSPPPHKSSPVPRPRSSPPPPQSSPPPPPRSSPPPPRSSPPPPYKSSPPPPWSSPPPPYQSSPPPPYQSSPPPPYQSSPPPPYQSSPPPSTPSPAPDSPSGPATGFQASGWQDGSATFYGAKSGEGGEFGGACGYSGSDIASFYSTRTAALSTPLFSDGRGCGRCYEIRCAKSKSCNPGSPSIVVTGTNLCPPNWDKPSDNGGWCNPPRQHFDMTQPSFEKLAERVAGIVPIQFRRFPCQRSGGVRFCVKGNPSWLVLYVMNVGACGDISEMAVRMAGGEWVQMTQNWGIAYQAFASMDRSKALAVRITGGSSAQTIIVDDAIPAYWSTGLSYQGSKNFW